MIPALSKLMQGHLALQVQPDFKVQLLKRQPLLAPQEIEVCALVLKGMSYAGIAVTMGLKSRRSKPTATAPLINWGFILKTSCLQCLCTLKYIERVFQAMDVLFLGDKAA